MVYKGWNGRFILFWRRKQEDKKSIIKKIKKANSFKSRSEPKNKYSSFFTSKMHN